VRAIDAEHYLLEIGLKRDRIPGFDRYPFSLPALRHLESLTFHPKITFIVGENGSGKSTLLEAIAIAWGFNPEGGTRNFNFQTRTSHSPLHEVLKLVRGIHRAKDGFFLRAESFFNVASNIDDLGVVGGYGGRSLHEQSHGESFLTLMIERFRGNGFYVLDEPEAALSPQRQLSAIARIHELLAERSQFVIATHSPILMAYPDAWIYQIGPDGLQRVEYRDTEHYRVAKAFLQNPDAFLRELMT
jgi:predicted ATPase